MKKKLQPERMGLQPYFIPPHRFMGKEWFAVDAGGLRWYYHRPRQPMSRLQAKALDPTVDVGLMPIVKAVRSMGLETGPSCEGHPSKRHPMRLVPGLQSHARKVRSSGVVVTNVETGKRHLWRDKGYAFDAKLMKQTMKNEDVFKLVGVLPLRGSPLALSRVAQAAAATPGAWFDRCGSWYCVWVATDSAQRQRATWSALARRMTHA